jgi:putative redox protein
VSKPPAIATLTWRHALVFNATSGSASLTIDGDSQAGPSPVQALAISVAGCMAADIAHIVQRGRHSLDAFRTEVVAERAQSHPHRFVHVTLRFFIKGAVPRETVERAISLSREKYCSVWHSLREDIELITECDVE